MKFYIVAMIVLLVLVYDLQVLFFYGDHSTLSHDFLDLCEHWPIIPLLVGVALGHALWPLRVS